MLLYREFVCTYPHAGCPIKLESGSLSMLYWWLPIVFRSFVWLPTVTVLPLETCVMCLHTMCVEICGECRREMGHQLQYCVKRLLVGRGQLAEANVACCCYVPQVVSIFPFCICTPNSPPSPLTSGGCASQRDASWTSPSQVLASSHGRLAETQQDFSHCLDEVRFKPVFCYGYIF